MTFYVTAIIFVVGVLGLVGIANGFSILKLIRYLKEELLAGAGHLQLRSRSAQPDLQDGARGRRKSVVGLVVPTGYSFNLDGHQHLYDDGGPVHRAGAEHRPDDLAADHASAGRHAQLQGRGGITGAGFITLAATLSVVPDVPVAGMALILGIDRFMSECRALTNFIGNAVATIVGPAGRRRSIATPWPLR